MNICTYLCTYISPRAVCFRSTHTCLHARTCTHMHAPARETHPSHMLTSDLAQSDSSMLCSAFCFVASFLRLTDFCIQFVALGEPVRPNAS